MRLLRPNRQRLLFLLQFPDFESCLPSVHWRPLVGGHDRVAHQVPKPWHVYRLHQGIEAILKIMACFAHARDAAQISRASTGALDQPSALDVSPEHDRNSMSLALVTVTFLGCLLWCHTSQIVCPAASGLVVSISTRMSSDCTAKPLFECRNEGVQKIDSLLK